MAINSLNKEQLNSGDKFLLTMNDSERSNLFYKKNIKSLKSLCKSFLAKKDYNSFFQILGLEVPKSIKIDSYNIVTTNTYAHIRFNIWHDMTNIELSFYYYPHNKINERINTCYIKDYICLHKIPFKNSANIFFKLNYDIINDNIPLKTINASNKYYYDNIAAFNKITDLINNDKINEILKKWKFYNIVAFPKLTLLHLPKTFINLYPYIEDYDAIIGLECFTFSSYNENHKITEEILQLFQNQEIIKGKQLLSNTLNNFAKKKNIIQ